MPTETRENPCELCSIDPEINTPTLTPNRSLFNINTRQHIEPICAAHEDLSTNELVETARDYGGIPFVITCITQGVFTEHDARTHLDDSMSDEIANAL